MHVFPVALAVAFLAIFIYSLVWAHTDARLRGKNPWLVVLMVILVAWPAGLVVWAVFRPEERDGSVAKGGRHR